MANSDEAYPIESCQYTAGGFKYDVTIFRQREKYHAAWYCPRCLTQTETTPCNEWNSAKQDAYDAIGAHHFYKHVPGEPPREGLN
ncbi:hypothetical protein [Lacipirellula parvula]|uniref:Uncharacterized protein n=1 Tax=Lacipirellula parvula TaxID=2650471 RepID=A0A5K7X5A6_9BACT|nr:hypothetical protein [Lacipirellula parvula]BBO31575.1 hypothetical protein PLANPX_1187 [Lacipirellula parvula]